VRGGDETYREEVVHGGRAGGAARREKPAGGDGGSSEEEVWPLRRRRKMLKAGGRHGAEVVRWALDFRSRDFICLRLDEWSSEKKLSRLQIMVAMKCFADFYVILCLMSRIFIMIN
jgi:hypothetical protein